MFEVFKEVDIVEVYNEKVKKYYDNIPIDLRKEVLNICKNNKNLVIAGNVAIELLTDDIQLNNPIVIYTINGHIESTKLAEDLAKKGLGLIKRNTDIYQKEFSIDINTYPKICKIISTPIKKNVKFLDIIHTIDIDNLTVLSPVMQLLEIYQKLYNIDYSKEWEDLRVLEKKVFNIMKSMNTKNIIGAAEASLKFSVRDVLDDLDILYIGQDALNYYLSSNRKTQITSILSDNIDQTTHQILNKIKGLYKEQPIKLIGDIMLRKVVIYHNDRPIISIYNSMEYELIPYENKYANPIVTLRFLLIELWNVKVIAKFLQKPSTFYDNKMIELINNIKHLRNHINETKTKIHKEYNCIDAKYFINKYKGTYIDLNIEKKRILKGDNKIPPKYYK